MPIELSRTFSSAQDRVNEGGDWSEYLGSDKGKLRWKDLHDEPLVIVLGEAGIGKTVEFELEVQRLRSAGKFAFFIPLNQLVSLESWGLALADSLDSFERWKASSQTAIFLLDAVDEARLKGQADFERAMSILPSVLRGFMARVHVVISSRPADWSIDAVKAAVDRHLCKPITTALSASKALPPPAIGAGGTLVEVIRLPAADAIELLVLSLDPLSDTEARRLADAYGTRNGQAFWDTVADGGYTFMATRPLDLEWMVRLWNEKQSLGTFCELIEFNVQNRLTELNPSYLTAAVALSQDRLREGAEILAAAAELSGRAYVATGPLPTARADEVAPIAVLSGWSPNDVAQLLASAIFDEATYGRVRFHHRTIRAYLAACWVNRQLVTGVSFQLLQPLFASSPFGTIVLIPARRWALCWLAAINVEVREWLTRHFPEMLLFDGDPEAWDSPSADQAFLSYIERLTTGLRTDWYNSESEFRRVGRRLSHGLVADLLASPALPARATTALLSVAKYGHLTDCATVVNAIYRDIRATERERRFALDVLDKIATHEQRVAITNDIVSGQLQSNELKASALPVANWQGLSVDQLVAVFTATLSEDGYGSGPMARAVNEELLPTASAASAELLLRAVVGAFPRPETGQPFARFPDSAQPERAWLLDVLPNCFERLLTQIPRTCNHYPDICVEAAERIESLRDSGFTDRDEFIRIHAVVAEHPVLRWQVALEIARSEDIKYSIGRLTWGMSCLVSFATADVAELTLRANDLSIEQGTRNIWFTIGMEVAFRGLRGSTRTQALATLMAGPESTDRRARIASMRQEWVKGIRSRRLWRTEDAARKREQRNQHEANRIQLLGDVARIHDASHLGALHWLIQYSYNHAGRRSLTHVDYEVICKDFGQAVADALADGLKVVWKRAGTPNPADYKDGAVPWEALTALAGLHTMLDAGMEITSLNDSEAGRAARLAVWELNGPPSWFDQLARTHGPAVSEALSPWIERDAQISSDDHRWRRGFEMALQCSSDTRAILLGPLVPMVTDGRIDRPETLRDVVKALRAAALLPDDVLAELCRARVAAATSYETLVGEIHWLGVWLEVDPTSAFSWFEQRVAGQGSVAGALVNAFSKIAQDCKWVKLPADPKSIDVLLRLHSLLGQHLPSPEKAADPEYAGTFEPVIVELRSRISGVLIQSSGTRAHQALVQLMTTEVGIDAKQWFAAQVVEHAALEASRASQIEPGELREIGLPFMTAPKSESQLFAQVMARLEEVRVGIEEGPFSDRRLFRPGMPEMDLQSWLAARFRETQNRRFTVTREEQVHDDKKPDIQLGCPQGKVCVEIKPLYRGCSYSANSLVDTLRIQIVSQYLKGFNSGHGILVLFRLDNKTWDIPGGLKRQPFSELVKYLQMQAHVIRIDSPGVDALQVVGANCI